MAEQLSEVRGPAAWRLWIVALQLAATVTLVAWLTPASFVWLAPLMGFLLLAGLAQMLLGQIPAGPAAALGAVLFSVCAWIDPLFRGRIRLQPLGITDWLILLAGGAAAGYFGRQLLAGLLKIAEEAGQLRGRRVYSVPRRFGIGTLLLATTLFAVLFAILQWARVRPETLVFYSAFVVTVSVAQMVFERSPRWASVVAGGVYLPLSMILIPLVRGRPLWRGSESPTLFFWIVLGLVVGYLGGALVAGIFLASDYVTRWFRSRPKMTSDANW